MQKNGSSVITPFMYIGSFHHRRLILLAFISIIISANHPCKEILHRANYHIAQHTFPDADIFNTAQHFILKVNIKGKDCTSFIIPFKAILS